MKVEELIIDGFKSYATRTIISQWDPQFNCITGLNGSGKSNILDSICFVLGITTMSTVRANNLQDLIYKRGQAGVTKASVTIIFDNSDKSTSPIGFEDTDKISVCRQVVLGGTSKYLINGHRAQQQTVQHLFQSVQLNINNPNFLIMQGRITKVLNMKPTEILAMIEEAAGTRMFEDRRDKALKTMAKKNKKMDEINALLREEIEPKLEKLRAEKRAFLEFQQAQSEVERLTKVVVAHDYIKYQQRLENTSSDLAGKQARAREMDESIKQASKEIANLQEDIHQLKERRQQEFTKGGKFQGLEAHVKSLSHNLVRLNTHLDLKGKSLAEEEQAIEKSQTSLAQLESVQQTKVQAFEELKQSYTQLKQDYEQLEQQTKSKEELLQTLQTGVSSKEGGGYMEKLKDMRQCVSLADTEIEQGKVKIQHLRKLITEIQPKAEKAKQENSRLSKNLDKLRSDATQITDSLQQMGWSADTDKQLRERQQTLEHEIQQLTTQADQLKRRVANVDFSYSDPSPTFDRSKVKGLVAQLFTLDPSKFEAATALEVCAGGRLYNVVVDTEKTATQLLERGKLKRRVTIIPLNKISAFRASAERIQAAQQIAPNKAHLALELVGYDKEVSAAMDYVFGSTLVCADADAAKAVTFHPNVRLKSVTLEGDVYDPAGTLSGGSRGNSSSSSSMLVTLQKLNEINSQLKAKSRSLQELEALLQRESHKITKARSLQQELDLKTHEINLAQDQIRNNSFSSIINKLQGMVEEVETLQNATKEAHKRKTLAQQEIKDLERDMDELKSDRGSKLEQLEGTVVELKAKLANMNIVVKERHKEFQIAQIEADQVATDVTSCREQLEDNTNSVRQQKAEIDTLKKEIEDASGQQNEATAQLEAEMSKLSGYDQELKELEGFLKRKNGQKAEENLEIQRLKHELEEFGQQQSQAEKVLRQLEEEYDWIQEDSEQFGRAGTPYAFQDYDLRECRENLKICENKFKGMKKSVNGKVMNMIDNVEKKEIRLKQMLRTVIRDKGKIEEAIQSLDQYKREALEETWGQVNKDFGEIFSDLLPGGSFAKLQPPQDKDVTSGLEVHVRLGKVWKQSLTELSGGQRSLIALSLILALLKFKPAPMYILDEVDAALDLSHTENIGRIIKTQFKSSQFIVVSLKDGFFTNANRVFRTRFQEGTSVVSVM